MTQDPKNRIYINPDFPLIEIDDDPREDHDPVYLNEQEHRGFNTMNNDSHFDINDVPMTDPGDEQCEEQYDEALDPMEWMKDEYYARPDVTIPPYRLKAHVYLSGASMEVGVLMEKEGDCVFFRTEDNFEPVFMSTTEAKLLVAALQASITEIEDD